MWSTAQVRRMESETGNQKQMLVLVLCLVVLGSALTAAVASECSDITVYCTPVQ